MIVGKRQVHAAWSATLKEASAIMCQRELRAKADYAALVCDAEAERDREIEDAKREFSEKMAEADRVCNEGLKTAT